MGKILQIRVSAWTYNEDDVVKTWPKLTELVWKERDQWASVGAKHGVMELAEALPDVAKFGNWPQDLKDSLHDDISLTTHIAAKLSDALANWQPAEANHLSDTLEDTLSGMEKKIPDDLDLLKK